MKSILCSFLISVLFISCKSQTDRDSLKAINVTNIDETHKLGFLSYESYYFDLELSAVIREAILWEKKIPASSFPLNSINFSKREIEIIVLSCREFSSKEIANQLFISVRTVEKDRNHIMEKANAKNFIGAILFALKRNLITLEDI